MTSIGKDMDVEAYLSLVEVLLPFGKQHLILENIYNIQPNNSTSR